VIFFAIGLAAKVVLCDWLGELNRAIRQLANALDPRHQG
jgi:hypothetical protein